MQEEILETLPKTHNKDYQKQSNKNAIEGRLKGRIIKKPLVALFVLHSQSTAKERMNLMKW